ncbi:MAG TPA: AAA family ATPase [Pyrinomonadaceae bacterium]|nr:AAA family ATPase [Pyrinomonadaceae bacterium]
MSTATGNTNESSSACLIIDGLRETRKTMQIILDKIKTPTIEPRLSRARLLNMLHGSVSNCTSTIVNGRAGTGKTLLAADFARRSGRRVSWYKVDAADGELSVFFKYLVESVRQWRPGFGRHALMTMVEVATIEDISMLAEAFVYELLEQKGEPLLIVVDDLHLVYDAEWVVPFFRRLLPLLPAEAHVLITGRSLPPAPLWRMRSKQTLCVIEEPTLSFTELETKRLFASYGLNEAQAAAALKQTRGRAATLDAMARVLAETGSAIATEQLVAIGQKLRRKRNARQRHGYML